MFQTVVGTHILLWAPVGRLAWLAGPFLFFLDFFFFIKEKDKNIFSSVCLVLSIRTYSRPKEESSWATSWRLSTTFFPKGIFSPLPNQRSSISHWWWWFIQQVVREKKWADERDGQYKMGGQVSRARLVLHHRPSGAVRDFSSPSSFYSVVVVVFKWPFFDLTTTRMDIMDSTFQIRFVVVQLF